MNVWEVKEKYIDFLGQGIVVLALRHTAGRNRYVRWRRTFHYITLKTEWYSLFAVTVSTFLWRVNGLFAWFVYGVPFHQRVQHIEWLLLWYNHMSTSNRHRLKDRHNALFCWGGGFSSRDRSVHLAAYSIYLQPDAVEYLKGPTPDFTVKSKNSTPMPHASHSYCRCH